MELGLRLEDEDFDRVEDRVVKTIRGPYVAKRCEPEASVH